MGLYTFSSRLALTGPHTTSPLPPSGESSGGWRILFQSIGLALLIEMFADVCNYVSDDFILLIYYYYLCCNYIWDWDSLCGGAAELPANVDHHIISINDLCCGDFFFLSSLVFYFCLNNYIHAFFS